MYEIISFKKIIKRIKTKGVLLEIFPWDLVVGPTYFGAYLLQKAEDEANSKYIKKGFRPDKEENAYFQKSSKLKLRPKKKVLKKSETKDSYL